MVLEARGNEVMGLPRDGGEAVDAGPPVAPRRGADGHPDAGASTASRRPARSPRPGCRRRVLVLTTSTSTSYVYDALRAGAAGFLLKATPPDRLAEGVAHRGRR